MQKGKLYLIPSPLGEDAIHTIPPYVVDIIHRLDYFIAERAKTARHFIKQTQPLKAFSELTFYELNKRTPLEEQRTFLDDTLKGHDIGLLSEAGCPGIADPGAMIVKLAYEKEIEVVPLVGPSSILMALMASGMNGQQFCFHGYLSPKKPELIKALKRLEQESRRLKQTQIFIETPYRNHSFIDAALQALNPKTKFCIACDISLSTAYIKTYSIQKWKSIKRPDLHKRPAIFLLYSG